MSLKVVTSISETLIRATTRKGSRKKTASHRYGMPITAPRPASQRRRRVMRAPYGLRPVPPSGSEPLRAAEPGSLRQHHLRQRRPARPGAVAPGQARALPLGVALADLEDAARGELQVIDGEAAEIGHVLDRALHPVEAGVGNAGLDFGRRRADAYLLRPHRHRRRHAERSGDAVADPVAVSYTHLRAHETPEHLVCRLLLEKKKK